MTNDTSDGNWQAVENDSGYMQAPTPNKLEY